MPQTVEYDTRELRVCILPFEELFADEHRLHRQTVGEPQQHPGCPIIRDAVEPFAFDGR